MRVRGHLLSTEKAPTPPAIQSLLEEIDPLCKKDFNWHNGILRRKNKLVVPDVAQLKDKILGWLHGSSIGGHSGRDATLHRRN
ncbi:hypothetical protein V2J09_008282 [Rumex salicifolius]